MIIKGHFRATTPAAYPQHHPLTHTPRPRLCPRAQSSTPAPPERAGPRAGAAQLSPSNFRLDGLSLRPPGLRLYFPWSTLSRVVSGASTCHRGVPLERSTPLSVCHLV